MKDIPVRNINKAPGESDLANGFSIRSIETMLSGKDMVQELHRHDFFYVLALEKGAGSHTIDFTTYKVGDHSVFFMRPGQVHELKLKSGSTGYLIGFKTDFYYPRDKHSRQLLQKASSKNLCRISKAQFKKLQTLLTYMFEEYKARQDQYWEVIKASLGIFFIELVRNRQSKAPAREGTSSYTQERFEEFMELLETDVTRYKQVSYYADKLNISTYQLNAITKAALGKTSSELINEQIILEAKRYLLATSSQVNQIAYHLGYEDTSYFIRFFKKHTGHTPESFRNNFS